MTRDRTRTRFTRALGTLLGLLVGMVSAACSGAPANPEGEHGHDTGAGDAGYPDDAAVGPDTSKSADAAVGPDAAPDATTDPDGGVGNDGGPNLGWAGQTDIESIFQTYCAGCHGAQWASCWNVQANAQNIDQMVSSGAMPRGGMLPPAVEMTLLDWIEAGAQCTGPDDPYDAGGGPPPPPGAPGASGAAP
jgi:hypothetical protein